MVPRNPYRQRLSMGRHLSRLQERPHARAARLRHMHFRLSTKRLNQRWFGVRTYKVI